MGGSAQMSQPPPEVPNPDISDRDRPFPPNKGVRERPAPNGWSDPAGEGRPSSRTKPRSSREVTTRERSAKEKRVTKHELTAEERSAMRKARREREAKLKALSKSKKEESSEEDDDDEEEEEEAATTGLEGAKFDLSNQNNITINNDNKGVEHLAKLMSTMYNDLKASKQKESSSSRAEKKSKSVEKPKERKKVKQKEVIEEEQEETTTTVTKKTKKNGLGARLAKERTRIDTLVQTMELPETGPNGRFLNGPRQNDTVFIRGVAEKRTVTTTLLQRWLQQDSHFSPLILFWETLYMWPRECTYILACFALWLNGHIGDDMLSDVICETLTTFRTRDGSKNEALQWFLTEWEPVAAVILVLQHAITDQLKTPEYKRMVARAAMQRMSVGVGAKDDTLLIDPFFFVNEDRIIVAMIELKCAKKVPLTDNQRIFAAHHGLEQELMEAGQ